jgi:hypothetical protein
MQTQEVTMTDLAVLLATLRRPKILVRAARAGVTDYRRERDLKRFIRNAKSVSPEEMVERLLVEETRLEATRTAGDATYSIQRHVTVLAALIAEARHLPTFRHGPALPVAA